jgi:hypothetical protein
MVTTRDYRDYENTQRAGGVVMEDTNYHDLAEMVILCGIWLQLNLGGCKCGK